MSSTFAFARSIFNFAATRFTRHLPGLFSFYFALLLMSCGGGGGGGVGGTNPSAVTVSGAVMAPVGQLTFDRQTSLLELLAEVAIPSAIGAVSGLTSVGDGTIVELVRIDAAGNVLAPIAQTTTTGGRYAFDLRALSVTYSSDLLVRARNAVNGSQMRAIVARDVIDITPISEALVQTLLSRVSGGSIVDLTLREAQDAVAATEQLIAARSLVSGPDLQSTVSSIKEQIENDDGLSYYIRVAGASGDSAAGPGDIGNYVPMSAGYSWRYRVTVDGTQQPPLEVSALGQRDPFDHGRLILQIRSAGLFDVEEQYTKSSLGLTRWSSTSPYTAGDFHNLVLPRTEYQFPLRVGSSFTQMKGRSAALDFDGDSVGDSTEINSIATVEGFESVTVPYQTLQGCARIVARSDLLVKSSATRESVNLNITETNWLCPGVGLAKQISQLLVSRGSSNTSSIVIQELESFTKPIRDIQFVTLASNDLVEANGKLYASVPGYFPNGNSVAVIDPIALKIERYIPIGTEPNRLVASADGRYLYVALDGESSIKQIDLSSALNLGGFALPSIVGANTIVDSLAVAPDNSDIVAASYRGNSFFPRTLSIFVRGQKAQNEVTQSNIDRVLFDDVGSRLFAISSADSARLDTYTVGPSGLGIGQSFVRAPVGFFPVDLSYANGLLFNGLGEVFDANSLSLLRNLAVPVGAGGVQALKADSTRGRVFFLAGVTGPSSGMTSRLFEFKTNTGDLVQSGELQVMAANVSMSSLVVWGKEGLAFRGSDARIYILRPN